MPVIASKDCKIQEIDLAVFVEIDPCIEAESAYTDAVSCTKHGEVTIINPAVAIGVRSQCDSARPPNFDIYRG